MDTASKYNLFKVCCAEKQKNEAAATEDPCSGAGVPWSFNIEGYVSDCKKEREQ